jgi:hypothetical protein
MVTWEAEPYVFIVSIHHYLVFPRPRFRLVLEFRNIYRKHDRIHGKLGRKYGSRDAALSEITH